MKSKKKKIVLLVFLIILVYAVPFTLAMLAIHFENEKKTFEIKDGQVEISKGKMTIEREDAYYNEEEETYYVTGYLKNKTKEDYESISVKYRLYDVDENILGEATAYLEELEEGQVWKFKATYYEIDAKEVSTFEFSGIDYY